MCNLQSLDVLKQTVDLMVSLGLRDLGYQYFNLDDCERDGMENNSHLESHRFSPTPKAGPPGASRMAR
jgi:hypothetical protein